MSYEIFVPGRLCLFGEHSDWASSYNKINSDVYKGAALVLGINLGIYASVNKDECIIFKTKKFNSEEELTFKENLDIEILKKTADEGSFFSYVAGTCAYMIENYNTGGININCYKITLPIKKGLSSSAAICVLVAESFNKVYDLKLSTDQIMDIAYKSELLTPSRCGRLDQICAYGRKLVHVIFDTNKISVKEVNVKKTIFMILADLHGEKDTIKILSALNSFYPFYENEKEKKLHEFFGIDNFKLVDQVRDKVEEGKIKEIGDLMNLYQNNFDEIVKPFCSEELESPILHSLLDDENIKKIILGGKGVGSHGDGMIQFILKSKEDQIKLADYLENEKKLTVYKITIPESKKLKTAVIPLAGYGTRMYPFTKIVSKAFLPIIDTDKLVKPALFKSLEQLYEIGIDKIILIINKEDRFLFEKIFSSYNISNVKGSFRKKVEDYEKFLLRIKEKIIYVEQNERKGLGHAVYKSLSFIDGDFILILGDYVFKSEENNPLEQIINFYNKENKAVLLVNKIDLKKVPNYGVVSGDKKSFRDISFKVKEFYEKPSIDYAEKNLFVRENDKNNYYIPFGIYVLNDQIQSELKKYVINNFEREDEINITEILNNYSKKNDLIALIAKSDNIDIGNVDSYKEALNFFDP